MFVELVFRTETKECESDLLIGMFALGKRRPGKNALKNYALICRNVILVTLYYL